MLLRLECHHARLVWDADRQRRRAACRDMGPELFLPAGERTENAANQVAEAKGVCAQCGVRLHCLTDALVANPDDGIWGAPLRANAPRCVARAVPDVRIPEFSDADTSRRLRA